MQIRPLTFGDEPLIWHFLMLAAHESEMQVVRDNPHLTRYAANWGRAGDCGCVALENDLPIGAAWLRLWPDEEKGFGYLADDVPELAMAVIPEWRGQGIGAQLLESVLQGARRHYQAVSLSVRADNPAVRLYHRAGFEKVPDSESVNRIGGQSFIMRRFL